MTVYTPRQAARVLLLDAADRVLLFHGWDPARPGHRYWFTPGGGLDPGESSAHGAARELAEETGLRVTPEQLGEPVWRESTEFTFGGEWFRQQQEFFLCRVPAGESAFEVDTAGFDQIERDSIDEHRWWSVADLERTGERFYPTDLPALLRRVLGGEGGC
ncbi:NUDIX hydrolase [Micromonospora sp. NPDC050397]|uniref:NUDIX hydrolase n=1 Tax=Micromonospora sp. NPDC050397 TaxID=3364279 RepID=UPI0038507100